MSFGKLIPKVNLEKIISSHLKFKTYLILCFLMTLIIELLYKKFQLMLGLTDL